MSDFPRYKIIQKPFVEPSTKLFIKQVIKTTELLNKVVSNVNYLRYLIEKNDIKIIIENSYSTVIEPIVELEYLDNLEYYFFIQKIPISDEEIPYLSFSLLSWKKYNEIQNTLIKNLEGQLKITTETSYLQLYNSFKNMQDITNKNYFYNLYFDVLDNILSLNFSVWKRDLLNEGRWISIGSSSLDLKYISETTDISIIPAELKNLIRYINLELEYLQITNFDSDTNTTIYSYNPDNLLITKCLLSTEFPQWTGKFLLDCFIPDSNENVYTRITNMINEINQSNKIVKEDYYVLASYTLNNIFYISIIKFIIYEGTLSIKEYKININDFILRSVPINNDVIINGGLEVSDIIKMNTYNNEISFNAKLGINQTLQEIVGKIDVDGLGLSKIKLILKNFIPSENNSNVVVKTLPGYSEEEIINTLKELNLGNEIFIFSCPIEIAIKRNEIKFLYVPPNDSIFKNKEFSEESYKKIEKLVNEIYRMKDIIPNNEFYIQSFTELINDTEYNYMCSIRGKISDDIKTIYFVSGFLLVNSITTDPSYKNFFIEITDNLSSSSRLINYSNYVYRIPEIQSQLEIGDSVDSFTKYINDSTFERFGNKNLKVTATILGSPVPNLKDCLNILFIGLNKYYFNEQNPEWNLVKQSSLFLSNGFWVLSSIKEILEKFRDSYGFTNIKTDQNFIIPYIYSNQVQLGMINIAILGNKYILFNCFLETNEFINYNVMSTGDNFVNGNIQFEDNSKNKVFQVDTSNNSVNSLYRMGIGNDNPLTTFQMTDTSFYNITSAISLFAELESVLDFNMDKINDDCDLNTVVNTFVYQSGLDFIQDKLNYFFIFEIPESDVNLNGANNIVRYHYLYPSWINKRLGDIDEPNNKKIVELSIYNNTNYFKKFSFIPNCTFYTTIEWLYGSKFSMYRVFMYRGRLHFIGIGSNLLLNNIKINTNTTIKNLFDNMENNSIFLQWLIYVSGYTTLPIYNFNVLKNNFDLLISRNIQNLTTIYYNVFDFSNLKNSNSYEVNLITGEKTLLGKTFELGDGLLFADYFFQFVRYFNSGEQTIIKFLPYTSGVFTFNDGKYDNYSLSWVQDISGNTASIYSLQVKILDLFRYSAEFENDVFIRGDVVIRKDNFSDFVKPYNDPTNNYVTITPSKNFFGIGSNKSIYNYGYYDFSLITFNFDSLNLVAASEFSSPINALSVQDLNLLKSLSANSFYSSIKSIRIARKNNVDTDFQESFDMSKKYNTNYGSNITFQIEDKKSSFCELGNITMYLEDYKKLVDNPSEWKSGLNVYSSFTVDSSFGSQYRILNKKSILKVTNDGKIFLNEGNLLQSNLSNSNPPFQSEFKIDTQVGTITLADTITSIETVSLKLINKLINVNSNIDLTIKRGENCSIENLIKHDGYCTFNLVTSGGTVTPPIVGFFINIDQEISNTNSIILDNPFGYINMYESISFATTVTFELQNIYITEYSFINLCSSKCDNVISAFANNITNGRTNISISTLGDTTTAPQIRFMIMN